ncbi:OLC1v1014263C1 [Oldenlandia corymbosa var. corymbosa]|uniref:OLC1v1014263C1 n=1 Tax=Oldenlandia corymbosa var. corymbosa TaxID=529605 RepID=A0AAV1E3W2_OLDCO|nr:OLC1v1014263C1 [Oldenlandia corymbosa var. corymbosa]
MTKNKQIKDETAEVVSNELSITGSSAPRKRNKSPGIRIIGGRIYDSLNGKSCHQCRQKTMDFSVSCKNHTREKQCTLHYCHRCLLNRYGEKAEEVTALELKWKCPYCRGVCNCCKCMKRRGCMPTGRLFLVAKAKGYSSVSDMLQLEEFQKPPKNVSKKHKASHEESAASSKRGKLKTSIDDKSNSVCPVESLIGKGNQKDGASTKESKPKSNDGKDDAVNGKDKKDVTADKRLSGMGAILTKVSTRQEVNRVLRGSTQNLMSRKSSNAEQSNLDEWSEMKIRIDAKKAKSEIQPDEKAVPDLQVKVSNVEIPLPRATELTQVANLDFASEDVGNALQFLEFCEAFGQVLDLKQGESESLLQSLTCGREPHRSFDFSIERLHMKLLSMIVKDSENGCTSLKDRDGSSWMDAFQKYICSNSNMSKNLKSACSHLSHEGYAKLDGSEKLRILTFLCNEALGTKELRMWIDEKHMEFVQERKRGRKMILDEEKNNKIRVKNEVAKAILTRAPLSITEHENLFSKIKMEASHCLSHSDMRGTHDSVATRLNPVVSDASGRNFWQLGSYSGGMDVLLQGDVPNRDEVTPTERWFSYDLNEKAHVERYISSFKVNEEIEKNIQVTRDIESEIVKCEEVESALIARELELMRNAYGLQLEIQGLNTVSADSASSVKLLEEDLCRLRMKKTETKRRMNSRWEGFVALCLEFQKDISKPESPQAWKLMEEKESLENEIHNLSQKNNALQNSMQAFVEEVVAELQCSISALQVDIQRKSFENENLLGDINELKATLLSAISVGL